jgi:cyanophycinase
VSELAATPGPVHLVGGGWDPAAASAVYGPFLSDAAALAGDQAPTVACVVLDEGDGLDRFNRWAQTLGAAGDCRSWPVLVPIGTTLDPAALGDAHALLVDGGLTPGYADALVPVAAPIRAWLADGSRPYLGFSAGAAIAAAKALVGGWRSGGVPVCPEDTAEDLDEVTVVPGLGLVPYSVDVHCAQWGTLPRLIEAVRTGAAAGKALGIDENTVVSFDADGRFRVGGAGRAWLVQRDSGVGDVSVTPVPAGKRQAGSG